MIIDLAIFQILTLLPQQISSPKVTRTIKARCGGSLDAGKDWKIHTFWLSKYREPEPFVCHRTFSLEKKAHQITVVDIDKRDVEIRMWVDDQDLGNKQVERNLSVDCGEDINKCLRLGFGSARVVVPPGEHTIKVGIVKRE